MVLQIVEGIENFKNIILNNDYSLVIAYFTASWCGPCKNISPVVMNIAENNETIIVIKVDVDECEDISSYCEISCMPTFKFYKNKSLEAVHTFSGADSDNLINTIRNLLSETNESQNETQNITPNITQDSKVSNNNM